VSSADQAISLARRRILFDLTSDFPNPPARADNPIVNDCAPTDHRLGLTLKKYRTGGEQKVTVQHVSVNDNAQAAKSGSGGHDFY